MYPKVAVRAPTPKPEERLKLEIDVTLDEEDEFLDERGDVPAIELAIDPIADIPADELTLLGELMAWTSYIEIDLFLLFMLAAPGDMVKRRKQFYKKTAGLFARVKLVREAFADQLKEPLASALAKLLAEVEALAQVRNNWAHNPIIRFGPNRTLLRWVVGSGDFAGNLARVDASRFRPLMPTLKRLHINLTNLAALVRSPTGESYAIAFGEPNERLNAQVQRILKSKGIQNT